MSDMDARTFAGKRQRVLAQARELDCTLLEPYTFLSFITLAAIPAYAVADQGRVDGLKQQLIDPVLGWA